MNEDKSLLNPQAGDILREAIKKYPKTQIDIAEMLGISTKQLQNYSKGIFPKYKGDNIRALDKILGTATYGIIYEGEEISEKEVLTPEAVQLKIEEVKTGDEATMKDIRDLIASNKTLAEANKRLADAHHILAENNKELLQLTKNAPLPEPLSVTNRLTDVERGLSEAARNQLSMYAFQMAFQETVFDLLHAKQNTKKAFGEKVVSFLEKYQREGIPTL